MANILVITCPSGKQCSHLIPLLYGKPHFTLRLAAHSEASAAKLRQQYPDAEVRQADLASLPSCHDLLRDATAVYHVGPSFHSRERETGFNMIDAAVTESQRPGNAFQHFVYSGVLGTQIRQLMQHEMKSFVEERLYVSPLNWTILKPANFMDVYPVGMFASQEQPRMKFLWRPEVPNSLIALGDLAEVAAKVLVEGETHYLAEYPLASTMPVSHTQVCEEIGRQIGKEIEVAGAPFQEGVDTVLAYLYGEGRDDLPAAVSGDFKMTSAGDVRGDITRDEAERLILFSNRRGLRGNPNVMRWLLGREPTSVQAWVKGQLAGGVAPSRFHLVS